MDYLLFEQTYLNQLMYMESIKISGTSAFLINDWYFLGAIFCLFLVGAFYNSKSKN